MNYESMTPEQLDAAIAERVMGWRVAAPINGGPSYLIGSGHDPFGQKWSLISGWNPSTDIRCAFEVVEAMRERGWTFSCIAMNDEEQVSAGFISNECPPRTAEECANTMPRAICIAALRTLDE